MSFFFDILLLLGLGHLLALISKNFYKENSFLIYTLSIITLFLFYIISIGLFLDFHMFGGLIDNPTQFMYSSGIWDVPFDSFEELTHPKNRLWIGCGILMFCSYPLWLYMGIMSGYMLFGRKPDQTGVMGLI